MVKKARLGLYLEDEEIKKKIKIAAAKQGMSTTKYCTQAIEERLKKEDMVVEGEEDKRRKTIIKRLDKFGKEVGPLGISVSELIKEGRRR